MGAMAQQLAARLPHNSVRLQHKVSKVTPTSVTLASGETLSAKAVVVATDQAAAAELIPGLDPPGACGTTCFYFSALIPPVSEPVLVLNGEGRGPINHLCVPSVVARSYAPMGRHLISANSVGGPYQEVAPSLEEVRAHLVEWFGPTASTWQHLRTDWIPNALPNQSLDAGGVHNGESKVQPGIFVCGDYRETASINGALFSGRKTAEAIAQSLGSGAA